MVALGLSLLAAGCLAGADEAGNDDPTDSMPDEIAVVTAHEWPERLDYFETRAPGDLLPDGETCARWVLDGPSEENRPENSEQNGTTVDVSVNIDGAFAGWNERLAPRVVGDFTGTTEQILRWVACKWGFDENITRARAVTESSWLMSTAGDVTDSAQLCDLLELEAPCSQSYGLLQVKGTVHEGTYPFTARSTAFGAEYAMAWLRACFEGSFTWLDGDGYGAGDEWGCVGAWFSGEWWDDEAKGYIAEVRGHLRDETWLEY